MQPMMWRHPQELVQRILTACLLSAAESEPRVRLMGEIQTEVLKQIIAERYHVQVGFEEGAVV